MATYLRELLNDARLDGVHGVTRVLAPKRHASLIDRGDIVGIEEIVQKHCQGWGGYCDLLIPCRRNSRRPPAAWMQILNNLDIHTIGGKGVLVGKELDRKTWFLFDGYGTGEPLIPLLAGDDGRSTSRTVRVPRLSIDDPWYVAYLGILGSWPGRPDSHLLRRLNYRENLAWSDLIATEFEDVVGDADDLLRRLRDPSGLTPTGASSLHLQTRFAYRNMGFGGPSGRLVSSPNPDPALIGPNIVVVYEPGSISDLCLIWALRASHGMPAGFPLAVPNSEPVEEILDFWVDQWAQMRFGIDGDRRFRLVSSSVKLDVLRQHANERGSEWAADDYKRLLQAPFSPGRMSSDVVAFESGVGTIATWGPEDRDELMRGRSQGQPDLLTTVNISSHLLPSVPGLQSEYGFMDGPGREGVRLRSEGPTTIRSFRWPTGWTVLEAAVRDRGLIASPSAAGRAAATLLEGLGGTMQMSAMLSMPVLEMVNRLCERRGMTWFRNRVRQLAAETESAPDALAVIEAKLDDLSLRQFEGEERGITVDQIRSVFNGDREAARLWVRWAEARQLLIRGVEVTCEKCGHVAWRTLGESAPPLQCRGCGEDIQDPYREDGLVFRYRAGEPLLRAVEHDALSHLLAMRWWCDGGMQRSSVYGAYPGVDFTDPDSGARVGEADVLLVLADGSLVVGECKRNGVGLTIGECEKLDYVVKRLNARFSFLATTSWARDCPPIWSQCFDPAPSDPPRYVLSGEQLLEIFPENRSLFDWPGDELQDPTTHHASFVQTLSSALSLTRGP
jgi:hypothetical protein